MTEDAAYRATALGEAYGRIERLPVTVLLDNVRSLYNVGAFFRTADAVRAESIVLAGITPTPEDPRIAKTALGAERSVSWSKSADATAAIDGLRARGHRDCRHRNQPPCRRSLRLAPSIPGLRGLRPRG